MQKRPIILRSLLIVATLYQDVCVRESEREQERERERERARERERERDG